MAQIIINEISQNYTYNIGSSSFATVALPITACWGPAFMKPESLGSTAVDQLEYLSWQKFPATQTGLEAFVSTYRGPSSVYRMAKDYSYQMAMTLLSAGYDILVCRLCPGAKAEATIARGSEKLSVKAKYPGTFGNNLKVEVSHKLGYNSTTQKYDMHYENLVVYIVDSSGVHTAVENLVFVTDITRATDSIPYVAELDSQFIEISECTLSETTATATCEAKMLKGGTDLESPDEDVMDAAINLAKSRYQVSSEAAILPTYIQRLQAVKSSVSKSQAEILYYREWLYSYATGYNEVEGVYDLLKDKLTYNPQRIISPGWDDQNVELIDGKTFSSTDKWELSPMHIKLMDVAYNSRCATALLDVPKALPRNLVFNESTDDAKLGYAQKLSRYLPNSSVNANSTLYSTHGALFAPWGQYTYVGTSKQAPAPPAFLDLMIHRAMILNQTLQYEWALPTNRKHNLKLGKFDYVVPNKLLKQWQKTEGVGVNVITTIPDIGNTVWGNSTLYEVPPATYQALANLSTRYLVNAVEDVVYRCGISITFQYNNEQAYNKFYAGVTPILDTMKNVGAIDDYYVRMAADINGLDQVNANTVIGKIYLVVNGVINDIIVDLVALLPGTDLNQYKA